MASGTTIASAYVQIMPSADGIKAKLKEILDSEMPSGEESGKSFWAQFALGQVVGNAISSGISTITGTLTSFAQDAWQSGMSFDSAMSQVGATMLKTKDQTQELRAAAQEMGATTQFTATQAAEALNYMALAGYKDEQAIATLPSVLNLAAAGSMDLGQASDMVTDAMSALGLEADEAGVNATAFGDILAKTAARSNTSVAQLGDAMLTVGGTAKNLSGGTEELATALGILANNGIKASEGGTHLRNMILAMNPTTDAAVAAFKALGVSGYDADGNLRPLEDTFGDLSVAMSWMTQEQRQNYLTDIFNKTDLAAVSAMLAACATDINGLGVAFDAAGIDAEALGTSVEWLYTSAKSAGSEAEYVKDVVAGTGLSAQQAAQAFQMANAFVADGATQFSALSAEVANSNGAMAEMADIQMDNLAGDMTYLDSALDGLRLAFFDTFSDTARTVVQDATAALSQLTTAFHEDGVSGMVAAAMDIGAGIIQTIADQAPALIDSGIQAAVDLIHGLADGAADNAHNFIDKALPMLMEFSGSLRENAGKLIDAALHLIVELGKGLIRSLPKLIETVPTIVSNIAGIINDNAPKLIGAALTLIVELGKGLINAIPTLVKNIPKIIMAIVDVISAFNWINLGSTIIKNLGSGISGMVSFAKQSITKIAEALKGGVKNLPSALKTVGEDIVKGLWNGVSGMVSWVKSKFAGFASSIVSGVKSALGIHSPSRVFRDVIGKNIALGTADGVLRNAGAVSDALEEIAQPPSISAGTISGQWLRSTGYAAPAAQGSTQTPEGYTQPIVVQLTLDGRVVAESTVSYINTETRRTGVNPLAPSL